MQLVLVSVVETMPIECGKLVKQVNNIQTHVKISKDLVQTHINGLSISPSVTTIPIEVRMSRTNKKGGF